MSLYQLSPQERSLIAVNKAVELATSLITSGIYVRLGKGQALDGCLPDLGSERDKAKNSPYPL